jgi:putative ABC transport system ATP-binding protein
MEIFKNLNKKGITIVMITHEKEIAAYAERIILFRDGKAIGEERIEQAINL